MNLKVLFLKARLKWFPRFSKVDDFNKILKADGISVGKGTIFYSPNSMSIDRQRPWMLRIGDYCKITKGTVILTHDYSRSVLRRKYGDIIGEAGETIIGNNCFIGMNSILLMGTKLGDNVIVGAGSVVHGTFPSNVVIAGNPAKIISTLDDYYEKRKRKTVDEAKRYYLRFKETYLRRPSIKEMGPFFSLFGRREKTFFEQEGISTLWNGDEPEEIIADYLKTVPCFDGYDAFIEFCESDNNREI